MSKKNLLQESDIRRMMKFANIGALSDTFVEKLNETGYYAEEEAEEAKHSDEGHNGHGMPMREEEEAEDAPGDDLDLELDDEPGDEPALDDEPMDDAPAGDVQGALAGVQTVLKAMQAGFREMGMEEAADAIQVEMADEPEADAPMDDMPPMDDVPEPEADAGDAMGPDASADEPVDEMGGDPMEEGYADEREEMEEGLEEEGLNEEEELEENDDLFNEVVRRVARRLMNK